MKYFVPGFTLFLILSNHILLSQPGSNEIPAHGLWPRPQIIPIPTKISNVEDPVIWLDGTWFINTSPGKEYWNEKHGDVNKS